MRSGKHFVGLTVSLITDFFYLYLPFLLPRPSYAVAFLVHPRDTTDMYRKYPILRHTPRWFVRGIEHWLWPITVSHITGLRDARGESIPGFVISIPMTASTMLAHRPLALRHIRQAVRLARNRGARIVGLGALTSSLSAGGTALIDIPGVAVTTGHAYTGFSVTQYLFTFAKDFDLTLESMPVAIVGAAGSIGSISAQILARAHVRHLILIDTERKREQIEKLKKELEREFDYTAVTISSDLTLLRQTPFIITATNTPDALIREEHIAPGTLIIDDAQPSDVSPAVFENKDVVVLEAGAVHTPGISANFPMGLHGIDTNYCCMAELLILGSDRRTTHHTILRATLEQVDSLGARGTNMGFCVAPYQNVSGMITREHAVHVASLVRARITA